MFNTVEILKPFIVMYVTTQTLKKGDKILSYV